MAIEFIKTQSIGNDFVLIHENAIPVDPEPSPSGGAAVAVQPKIAAAWLKRFTVQVCDRKFGIGSDGVLVLGKRGANISMRMFNPDGSEDFCGNGLRCAAVCAEREGLAAGGPFIVEHGGIEVEATLLGGGLVRTKYGRADYTPKNVPVISERELFKETIWSGMIGGMPLSIFGSALTTGSTHVVIPTGSLPDDESFVAISSAIENDPKFPDRTSVIWTKEIEPMHLALRIWERGAGETLGCGTGSSAAAADYMRRRFTTGTVTVDNPGGTVTVTMDAWDAPIVTEGMAAIVYSGSFELKD